MMSLGMRSKLIRRRMRVPQPNLNMAYVKSVDQMVIAAGNNGIYSIFGSHE